VEQPVQEMVEFTVIYNKQKYEVKFALDETVDALKNHIEKLTGNCDVLCMCSFSFHKCSDINLECQIYRAYVNSSSISSGGGGSSRSSNGSNSSSSSSNNNNNNNTSVSD